ncbi:MAG: hypothetical protein PVG35_13915 [Desulfobacterales bacterium]
MKKMILIICVIMIGSFMVLTRNSFASGEMRGHHHGRAGHYQKWHQPAHYKHGRAWGYYPRQYHKWPRHTVVREINNYYGNSEIGAWPENEFNASVSVSDTGFSFSVGVKQTD